MKCTIKKMSSKTYVKDPHNATGAYDTNKRIEVELVGTIALTNSSPWQEDLWVVNDGNDYYITSVDNLTDFYYWGE